MVDASVQEVDVASQLNIKDPVLIERARVLAQRRNESVTATLRQLVDREWSHSEADLETRMAKLNALIDEVRANMPDETRRMSSAEIMESIYDDDEPDGFAQ
jgi:hypothetical protein